MHSRISPRANADRVRGIAENDAEQITQACSRNGMEEVIHIIDTWSKRKKRRCRRKECSSVHRAHFLKSPAGEIYIPR